MLRSISTRFRQTVAVFRTYRNPWLRIADYFGLVSVNARVTVRLRNGMQFVVRAGTSDFGVLDDVFMRNVYGCALALLKPNDLVIDVGAQCGAFAVASASRGANVLCFEPLPENAELLLENMKLNRVEARISVSALALASRAGTMDLYALEGDTGGATFFPAIHPEWNARDDIRKLAVRCITLHDVFALKDLKQCACLKLDCEGAEYEILRSTDAGHLRRIRTIIFEYHPNEQIGPIVQRLMESGFTMDVRRNPCIVFARLV